jgi:ribonuclease HI
MLILRFDGLFRPLTEAGKDYSNAGFMCYGWIIQRDGVTLAQGHGAFARGQDANSNTAEYLALIEGLDALRDFALGNEPICVCGDAKSIIDQMRGTSQVSASSAKPLYRQATEIAQRFFCVEWSWLPRKNNTQADTLSRKALQQIRRDQLSYGATVKAITQSSNREAGSARFLPVMDLRVYQSEVNT